MKIPLTDLTVEYISIKDEINTAIQRVFDHGQFILGPEVKAFEEEMAVYSGTKFAVGVASGTDALHLALLACRIEPGDEIITTPFTFIATGESITKCGAIPIFVDIEEKTDNIDPAQIEARITSKTKAILPVHLYGQPASMEDILYIARKYNLKVIEDCAQSLGAEYNEQKVGSLGEAGCLSFFPAKNLGAYGDGGMVITNNSEVAETMGILRRHGSKIAYYHFIHGFNSRLDALQAAILGVKLKHLEHWTELRRSKALLYNQLLSQIEEIEPVYVDTEGSTKSSCNYYTIHLKDPKLDRSELRNHLELNGIQTAIYYPLSLHLQDVYKHLGYTYGDFPRSEMAQEEVLSLPIYPQLSEDAILKIVEVIKEYCRGDSKEPSR